MMGADERERDSPDAGLIGAWLAARSLVRALPAPVAIDGGWRVDSNQPDEKRRYVFTHAHPVIAELGRTITAPRHVIKLAAEPDALLGLLDPRWRLKHYSHVMTFDATMPIADLPSGYRLERTSMDDQRHYAAIYSAAGNLAASGHAAETAGVFIYDRIETAATHQRQGLGRAIMAALSDARRREGSRQVLTATMAGRALYEAMGWRVHAPWSTAAVGD